jgi:hypothetical protein
VPKTIKRRPMVEVVRDVLISASQAGTWLTVEELAKLTNYHESSLSPTLSQIRRHDERYRVVKRRRNLPVENRGVIWEYALARRGA